MALIMMTGKYPPTKLKELFKANVDPKKPAYPAFVKKVHNWGAQVTDEYYKNYAVYQCPDDKIMEAVAALTKRYNFYAQVEGYRYRMELLVEAEQAMKDMMG